jgi:intracellular sulfur oxidation DsrE/DsrF family protein
MIDRLRLSLGALVVALSVAFHGLAPALAGDVHRLALQITDNDPQKMNTVLNVAANVSRHYSEVGQAVEIRVIAFNQGLHMLRDDTSPVKERLASFAQSMPNVVFDACNNTLQGMAKKEGKMPVLELAEKGWVILRP